MLSEEPNIISACQNGDWQNFGQLYEFYVKKLYDFFYFRVLHKQTAEDLTGISFFKAVEKINSYSARKGSFRSWLYQIAKNTLTDFYRTSRPVMDLEAINEPQSLENAESQTHNALLLEKIKKLLAALPDEQKNVIILRLWDELPFGEIAEITGKSPAACKMMFGRIMAKWREALALMLIHFFKNVL